jgi:large subunit ribosomal protein L15
MARGPHTPAHPTVYAPVNVGELARLSEDEIGVEELKTAGLVGKKEVLVKILGDGEIGRAVTVRAHAFSKTAKEKIEAAGGDVEVLER